MRRMIAGTVLILLACTVVPAMIRIGRKLPRERARPWVLYGTLWFGFALYLLLGAAVSHVAVAFGADPERAAIYAGLAAIAVVLAGLVNVSRGALVRRVTVPLAGLPVEKYTIVQLTDVHIGPILDRRFAQRRTATTGHEPERRRADRRVRTATEAELRSGRWALVPVAPPAEPPQARPA